MSDRPSGISSLRGSEISSRRLFGHDQGHEVICAIGSPRHTFGDKATQHICFTINNTPCTHISPSTQQNRRGSHISFGIMFFLLARDRIVSFLTGVLSSPLRLISGLFTLRIDSSHPFHILFQVSFRGVQRRRGELDLSRCSTSTRFGGTDSSGSPASAFWNKILSSVDSGVVAPPWTWELVCGRRRKYKRGRGEKEVEDSGALAKQGQSVSAKNEKNVDTPEELWKEKVW